MTRPALADDAGRAFHLERFHDFLALEQGSARTTTEAYERDLERFALFVQPAAGQEQRIIARIERDGRI